MSESATITFDYPEVEAPPARSITLHSYMGGERYRLRATAFDKFDGDAFISLIDTQDDTSVGGSYFRPQDLRSLADAIEERLGA